MTTYDLILRNGAIVTESGVAAADLGIADDRIGAIEPELAGSARDEIDASRLYVFPGVMDPHVHFNEPGRTDWEGFATGTRALAAGGGTTACDMPLNAHPPTLDAASFDRKRAALEASGVTDVALWGGLVPGNLDRLDELADRGVVGFKAFMSNSGIDDFAAVDDPTLYDGMARAARLGRIVAVHAENDEIRVRVAETFVFEAVFVLERTAKRSKSDIRDDVRDLLDLPGIELPTKARMRRALDRFAALNIAFVDAYQSVLMEEFGLTDIVSFDRHFDRVPGLRRIEP